MSKDNVLFDSTKRLFYLSDSINVDTISQINFHLLQLLAEDAANEREKIDFERKPIHIFINSCGGDVFDMWSLIDIMITTQTPIYTYCTGYAMSAAFQIFLAGDKRFITPHTVFLYHQVSTTDYGKYQDLVENREELDITQTEIENFVLERTSITPEQLEDNRLHKRDWFIHTEEALKLNIAHVLCEGIKIANE